MPGFVTERVSARLQRAKADRGAPGERDEASAEPTAETGDTGKPRKSFRGPSASDVAAGTVAGLFSVPEGMAYAAVGGFSPAAGLYAEIVPAILGSVLTPSVLMITTLTSAIAVTSGTTVAGTHLNPRDPSVVAALALTIGLAMAVCALIGAGRLLRRIPMAAMAGFSAGIAVQILAGGLANATGYKADSGHGQVWRIIQWGMHSGHWSVRSAVIAAVAIGVWGLIAAVRRMRRVALLVSMAVMSLVVAFWHIKVPLAGSLGALPHGLPLPAVPEWSAIPKLLPGACTIALIALTQAGGITTPQDPDGHRARSTRSLLAQAAANVAASVTHAMPVGGSLSRTGVVVAAGARSRWVGICAGSVLALLVFTASPELARIPVPLIGGLIAAVGCQLIAIRVKQVRKLAATSRFDLIIFVGMLALTVQESPLIALTGCVVVALVPQAVRAAVDGRRPVAGDDAEAPQSAITTDGTASAGHPHPHVPAVVNLNSLPKPAEDFSS